jgi:hypothetical protein
MSGSLIVDGQSLSMAWRAWLIKIFIRQDCWVGEGYRYAKKFGAPFENTRATGG